MKLLKRIGSFLLFLFRATLSLAGLVVNIMLTLFGLLFSAYVKS